MPGTSVGVIRVIPSRFAHCEHFGASPFELPEWVQQSGTWASSGGRGGVTSLAPGANVFGVTGKAFARYPVGVGATELSVDVVRPTTVGATSADAFNRANSTSSVGGPWGAPFGIGGGTPSAFGISGSKAYRPSGTGDAGVTWDTGASNGTLIAVVSEASNNLSVQAGSGQYMGLVFRRAADGSYFVLYYNHLYYVNAAGASTSVAGPGGPVWPDVVGSGGALVKVVLDGTSIVVKDASDATIFSVTSSNNVTATRHGFHMYANGTFNASSVAIQPRVDDWTFVGQVPNTAASSVVLAYDPAWDSGLSLDYDGTEASLVHHVGADATVLDTVPLSFSGATSFLFSYSDVTGHAVVKKDGVEIIDVDLNLYVSSFADAFSRANGAVGNGWVAARREFGSSAMTWVVSGGRVTCTANSSYGSTVFDALLLRDVGQADFEMSFRVPFLPSSPAFGRYELAAWRVADVNAPGVSMSYYLLVYNGTNFTAWELTPGFGGGFNAGAAATLAPGDVITIRCTGTLHEVEVNGSPSFSFNRTMNQTTGVHHGLATLGATWGEATTFDDFEIDYDRTASRISGGWAGLASDTPGADQWDEFCWTITQTYDPADGPVRVTYTGADVLLGGSQARVTYTGADVLIGGTQARVAYTGVDVLLKP